MTQNNKSKFTHVLKATKDRISRIHHHPQEALLDHLPTEESTNSALLMQSPFLQGAKLLWPCWARIYVHAFLPHETVNHLGENCSFINFCLSLWPHMRFLHLEGPAQALSHFSGPISPDRTLGLNPLELKILIAQDAHQLN